MSDPSDFLPSAIFGGLLWGDKAVRLVYMDEAGVHKDEPVTIVAGLIIDADRQLLLAERAVNELLSTIPSEVLEIISYSAKEVWCNRDIKDIWRFTDRLAFLRNMMRLPRRLGIPMAYGIVRREADWGDGVPSKELKLHKFQFDHLMAFIGCVAKADQHIRNYADPNEVATIVAEYHDLHKHLKLAPKILRDSPLHFSDEHFRPTKKEQEQGYVTQSGTLQVTKIRKGINFVDKHDDAVMYLSDACAFGIRRFFAELEHGEDFMDDIFGYKFDMDDFAGQSSYGYSLYPTIDRH